MKKVKMNLRLFDEVTNLAASTDAGMSGEVKAYYVKELLENAKPTLVHNQFGQKKPIPKGAGKTIEWRKFSTLPPALTPLVEGVTPDGTKRTVTTITGAPAQYGDYIKHTDVLQAVAYDPVVLEDCKEQGNQAGNTIDILTRNVMQSTTNVMYAGGKVSRSALTAEDKLTVADVFKAVNKIKRMNIAPINGDYVCIIHPDVETDVMASEEWQGLQKYTDAKPIFEGEIGKIGKCRFVSTSNAKIYKEGSLAVYGCLFLGANAYGVTELSGLGLEYIIKPLGYGDDPLNQRSSTGWKATTGAVLLNESAIVRYECCSYRSEDADTVEN